MTKRVVIHAGLPKCGSTSLQLRLTAARGELWERGVAYPLTERASGRAALRPDGPGPWAPQHMMLAAALEAPVPPPELTALLADFERSAAHTLVLSSESFAPRARAYGGAAFAPLRDFRVEVVLFARRRDDWLLAMYKQALRTWRRRYRGSFGRWLAEPPVYDRYTTALRVSGTAARLEELTGGRATTFDLEAREGGDPDTGRLFGGVLDIELERWPDRPLNGPGPLRGAEQRAGRRVNATHDDPAALFLAMTEPDVMAEPALREVVAAAIEPGFGDAAPAIHLMPEALSAELLAGGAEDRERLGFRPLSPRPSPAGTQRRDTLTVAEWRAMAERLYPRLGSEAASGLRAAAATVRELA